MKSIPEIQAALEGIGYKIEGRVAIKSVESYSLKMNFHEEPFDVIFFKPDKTRVKVPSWISGNGTIDDELKKVQAAIAEDKDEAEPKTAEVVEVTKIEKPDEAVVPKMGTPVIKAVVPVTITGIVRPAVSSQDALAAWQEFQALKTAILDKTDVMQIQGKNYTKKSGWRKFATFYNLTDKIVEETRMPDKNGFIWKIKIECTAPNGRMTEGVAMCSSAEKSGVRIEHDVYSTAHTRAKNRAISDMIAAGEVSAEEMN